MFRLVNWNIERKRPGSWQAKSLIEEIASIAPDVICLTEAWVDSLETLGGFTISSKGIAWSPQKEDERKVLIWSHQPWVSVEVINELEETGSAVTGLCNLAGIQTRIVGICVPYHFASPLGVTPKEKPWSQHNAFLRKLMSYLDVWAIEGPTIVLGDFNRRMPRSWGPKHSYELLELALENYEVVTRGPLNGVDQLSIDHIAVTAPLNVKAVVGRPAEDHRGRKRSDHFGVVADLTSGRRDSN
ncbi:MAG: endonuclease/exonuclease/phosphatase family protein [Henriciella sp.]